MLALTPLLVPKQILLLGAHCDDIEIGCGATVLHLAEKYPDAIFTWVVFCSTQQRAQEAKDCARAFLTKVKHDIRILSFRDGYLPWLGMDVKDAFEKLKCELEPDLIFTHHRDDRHQDHRAISDLTWNTWRRHYILEYEIPKYDGDSGHPNVFIPVREELAMHKIDLLMRHYATQQFRHWFSVDTFRALLRIRGVESGQEMAEAFYGRKQVFC